MISLFALFAGLSVVIVIAGIVLTISADHLADHTPLGRSLAGVVLLAGATSLPELAVGWSAVRMGAIDLTIGELLGSCLMNLLILAVIDLATRSRGGALSYTAAAHALSAIVCVLLAAVCLLGLLLQPPGVLFSLGTFSWVLLGIYLFGIRLIYLDQRVSEVQDEVSSEDLHEPTRPRVPLAVAAYLVATLVIFFVAPYLAHVADQLAVKTGLGETFFGTVFVALVTSLPECVATITSLRIGALDLAVGNIFGSNCFNIAIVAVVDLASPGAILSTAAAGHAVTAAAVVIVTSVAALGLLYRIEKRLWLIEPDALLLIVLILGALYLVYQQ